MARLLQTRDGAAQKFSNGGGADPQRGADFGIAQTFQPQKQAPALLVRKPLDGVVESYACLAIQQAALRVGAGAGKLRLSSGSKATRDSGGRGS